MLGSASTRARWRSCAPPAGAVFLGWIDGADVIFPNLDEARVLVGSTGPQIDLEALAVRFPHVVVTLGSMGAAYLSGTERTQITAPRIDVIDTTGAGDAFAAGFLARWVEGATPEEALDGGRAAAETCVAHLGARPVSSPEDHRVAQREPRVAQIGATRRLETTKLRHSGQVSRLRDDRQCQHLAGAAGGDVTGVGVSPPR